MVTLPRYYCSVSSNITAFIILASVVTLSRPCHVRPKAPLQLSCLPIGFRRLTAFVRACVCFHIGLFWPVELVRSQTLPHPHTQTWECMNVYDSIDTHRSGRFGRVTQCAEHLARRSSFVYLLGDCVPTLPSICDTEHYVPPEWYNNWILLITIWSCASWVIDIHIFHVLMGIPVSGHHQFVVHVIRSNTCMWVQGNIWCWRCEEHCMDGK